MSFKKDGEIKVFVNKKQASKGSQEVRYTVDDLVEDSDKELVRDLKNSEDEDKDEINVSNKRAF